jgi:hypothetical protein
MIVGAEFRGTVSWLWGKDRALIMIGDLVPQLLGLRGKSFPLLFRHVGIHFVIDHPNLLDKETKFFTNAAM